MINYNNRPLTILVIEDNLGDFTLIETFLKDQNSLAIIHAQTFKQASEILSSSQYQFDAILLDLTLPDHSGKKLISDIFSLCPDCPIIILTGYSDIKFSIESLSLGVADYLIKDDINAQSLYKSVIYGIERKKSVEELKESEKKYSDLFHLSPQPMWVYDMETLQFLDVNAAAIEQYGYNREEFLSMGLRDITPGSALPVIDASSHTPNKSAPSISHGLFSHKTKNGKLIEAQVLSNYINFKNKKAQIVLAIDITEQLKYISAIETQNKKLQEIAWIQSHVVRAPLAKIMGLVDVIQNHQLSEPEKGEVFVNILQASQELDVLVKEIIKKTEMAQLATS